MSEKIDDGGAAFPMGIPEGAHHGHSLHKQQGMSLRDYFAAAALPCALQAWKHHFKITNEPEEWAGHFELASEAYDIADAMLQARKEGNQP